MAWSFVLVLLQSNKECNLWYFSIALSTKLLTLYFTVIYIPTEQNTYTLKM